MVLRIFAESIQFTGADVFMIIMVLLAILIGGLGIIIFGCVLAKKAGEGSQSALVGWGVIAAGEALFLIASMIQGEFLVSTLVLGGALAIQGVMYSDARKKRT